MPESSNGRRPPMNLSAETKWEIFLAGHRRGDQPGRGGPQVAGRRVDGDRHPAHGQRRCLDGVGTQAGTAWQAARLAAGSGTRRDRAADPGGQSAGHRAGHQPGKSALGLSGPVPARVPAEVKEAVLKTVDDAVTAGFAHTWACALWQVSDSRVHRWRRRRRDTGTLLDCAPGGHPVHALLAERSPRSSTSPNAGAPSTAPIASWPIAAPTRTWCGSRHQRCAAC